MQCNLPRQSRRLASQSKLTYAVPVPINSIFYYYFITSNSATLDGGSSKDQRVFGSPTEAIENCDKVFHGCSRDTHIISKLKDTLAIKINAEVIPVQYSNKVFQCHGEQFRRYYVFLPNSSLQFSRYRGLILETKCVVVQNTSTFRCTGNQFGTAGKIEAQPKFRSIKVINANRNVGYILRIFIQPATAYVYGLWD